MKALLGILFTLLSMATLAQDSSSIVVHKDPRLDALVKKHIEINEYISKYGRHLMPGYRILVLSTNDRNKALAAKTTMFREFPELKSYLLYQSPYYKLKVGDFVEREDAEVYIKEIQQIIKGNVYVVRDIIEANADKSGDL